MVKRGRFLSLVICLVSLCGCGKFGEQVEESSASQEATEGCDPQLVNVEFLRAVDEVGVDPKSGADLEEKILAAREKALMAQLRESCSGLIHVDEYCYTVTEAFLTYQLGRCQMFRGNYKEAAKNLEAAAEMAKSMNYKRFVYACYVSLSLCNENAGLTKEALDAKEKSKAYRQ